MTNIDDLTTDGQWYAAADNAMSKLEASFKPAEWEAMDWYAKFRIRCSHYQAYVSGVFDGAKERTP